MSDLEVERNVREESTQTTAARRLRDRDVYGMAHNGATLGWEDVINHVRMWRDCA